MNRSEVRSGNRNRLRLVLLAAFALGLAVTVAACGGSATGGNGGGGSTGGGESGKKAKVAYIDGSCTNSWRITVRAEFEEAAEETPNIESAKYVCAHGELNQAISAIQSATVEGYDPIVVFSDFGEAILPAVKAAAAKGVTVVPWLVNIGGEPGKDYATFVGENYEELGKNTADFMAKEMHDKGNLIAIEGPPGNAYDEELNKYIKQRLAQIAPEIKWLATTFANWDPAESAQAASALLSKYPSVQGLITDEASTVPGIISRWQATGRPLPVIYSNDLNEVMALYKKLKPKNPTLAYGFRSARTYGSRVALEAAMAAWEGKQVKPGEYLVESPSYNCEEDCAELYDPEMPGSWVPTSKVPKEKLKPLLEGQ